jgi:hypothetical protein
MYRAVMETYPDGQWRAEPAKIAHVCKSTEDGSVETVRAVFGHFLHTCKCAAIVRLFVEAANSLMM